MSRPRGRAEEPSSSNYRHACAKCRHQRKKCDNTCLMAPYFPVHMAEIFQTVHRFFGVRNVSKILMNLDVQHRELATESIKWEASIWRQNPVHRPLGKYRQLEQELQLLRKQLITQEKILNQWSIYSSNQSKVGMMLPSFEGGLNSGLTCSLQGEQDIESQVVSCTGIPYKGIPYNTEGGLIPFLTVPVPSCQPLPLSRSHGEIEFCNEKLLQGQDRARQLGRCEAVCQDHMIIGNKGNNGIGCLETLFTQGVGNFGMAQQPQPAVGPCSMGQG
ncbi:LOB domain-containing protein 22-like [Juglans microcarpa x Juglans regia]|uniref:LOB domain-containing protein 22-like n=1 Tax=Juglans microcarpa x Juglans regia TaxID=2249226 RepID=UPI001B7F2927|nr:LOB domain-containing protein 22-like [Juglans microcarpa x Juglans regia]